MSRSFRWLRSRAQILYATAQICLLWVLCTPAAYAALQGSLQEQIARFAVPGASWQAVQTIQLSGVRMQSVQFRSSHAPLKVARALSSHGTIFQRVLTTGRAVILSGLGAGQHWLAEIQADRSGALGRVSALALGADTRSAHDLVAALPYEWLPSGAATRFSSQATDADSNVLQHIFSVPWPADTVSAYVSERLRRDGWILDPLLPSASGSSVWHRHRKQLVLGTMAQGEVSLLYVYLQQ